MSECLCESCRPADPAPTWTREYRMLCEARMVLSLPLEDRAGYLKQVEAKRGGPATEKLKAAVIEENKRARERQKGSKA